MSAAVETPVEVTVTRLAHGRDLPLPGYASAGSAGLDLYAAAGPLTLAPGARALVATGLALALPEGFEGQIRPRSGLALKHGVTVLNSPGTIDSDYRGEIGVLLVNLGETPFVVERGMRIAQLVIAPVSPGAAGGGRGAAERQGHRRLRLDRIRPSRGRRLTDPRVGPPECNRINRAAAGDPSWERLPDRPVPHGACAHRRRWGQRSADRPATRRQ